jgi:hypothetical protein
VSPPRIVPSPSPPHTCGGEGRGRGGSFSAIALAFGGRMSRSNAFFDSSWMLCHPSRSQCWEPRANRGRLRHCNGLRTPKTTGSSKNREGRSKVRNPRVRTSARLRSSGPFNGATSPTKRRMRPARCNCFYSGSYECLHSRFCRSLKVFYFSGSALVSQLPIGFAERTPRSIIERSVL